MEQRTLDDVAGKIDEVHQLEKEANDSYNEREGDMIGVSVGLAFPLYSTGHYVWGTVAAIAGFIFGFREENYKSIAKRKTEELSESVERISSNCLAGEQIKMAEENNNIGALVGVIHELDVAENSIERIAKARDFFTATAPASLIMGLSPYVVGDYSFLWCDANKDSPFVVSAIGTSILCGIVSYFCKRRIKKRLRKISGVAKDAYAGNLKEHVNTYQGGK